jgi:hypothetical protein
MPLQQMHACLTDDGWVQKAFDAGGWSHMALMCCGLPCAPASAAAAAARTRSAAGSQAGGGDGLEGGSADLAESASLVQKKLNGFLVTLYKERWEDSKRFLLGRVLLEHLQLLLILLQPQFLWSFDTKYW